MKEYNPLNNAQVFYRHRTKFGIPAEVFILMLFINIFAFLLCIIYFSVLSVAFFVLFFLFSVIPLKYVFKEDPQAHRAWISGILKSSVISNNGIHKKNVKFV
ncbi:VirB3 family type IV secretion system protein [Providencia rettgeri]|uniref:VirB3 family type IV secretion system protein n=1 Tax=Providencia rettgeri TaxID=587 RepID=UPI001419A32C|nr:VirB3 family type IV secretion system protein [Providencia rettgeri]NIH07051.1 hypothetical protein [Providencia rettgeri]